MGSRYRLSWGSEVWVSELDIHELALDNIDPFEEEVQQLVFGEVWLDIPLIIPTQGREVALGSFEDILV
ncbi:hypothetical protein Pmani_039059 [Petrolisthes manimaculis]|uniref:Uncharacterized protein n=1 Tax=Petrolisthes manimaculis TaxID=1843537 RepID=A0AAE1TJM7_9EUCA|nr:hypothetical protein Pmani_039059 [Petrolisthes manimaculis]